MFENQENAAINVLELLPKEKLQKEKFLLMASSLDGVIFCDKLAKLLSLNYELFFCANIKAPNNNECDIACISQTEDIILDENLIKSFNITQDFIYGQAKRVYEEQILKQVYKYRKGNLLSNINGKNILLVDDGFESANKISVIVKSLLGLGVNSLFLACAVMPEDLADWAEKILDEIYCVKKISAFVEIDFYYKNKIKLTENEIVKILEESSHYLPLQKIKETKE